MRMPVLKYVKDLRYFENNYVGLPEGNRCHIGTETTHWDQLHASFTHHHLHHQGEWHCREQDEGHEHSGPGNVLVTTILDKRLLVTPYLQNSVSSPSGAQIFNSHIAALRGTV